MSAEDSDALLLQRLAGRCRELESWLALLIIAHGHPNGPGSWRLLMSEDRAHHLRSQTVRTDLLVNVDYDPAARRFTLDAL